jgi:hypothetical protein
MPPPRNVMPQPAAMVLDTGYIDAQVAQKKHQKHHKSIFSALVSTLRTKKVEV